MDLTKKLERLAARVFPSDATRGQLGSIDFNIWCSQTSGVPILALQPRPLLTTFILYLYGIPLTFINFMYIFFEVYDMYTIWPDFNAFTQNFCLTLSHFAGALKIVNMFYRLPEVGKTIEKMRATTKAYVTSEAQQEAFQRDEVANKLFLIIYGSVVGTTGFLALVFVYINPSMAGQMFPYRVRMPQWLPFAAQVAYIGITDFMFAVQIVTIDYLNIALLNLLRSHLFSINLSFEELLIDERKSLAMEKRRIGDPNQRLMSIVAHHCMLIEMRTEVEYIFRLPVLLQFFTSLLISAVTGFQATVASGNSNSINSDLIIYFYCFCIFTQLFCYCWFGNEVFEQSKTLATSGFGSSWYHYDRRFRKSLNIFLTNAQRPFVFTGGDFVGLLLPSFAGVLSKAYSFIAVLRQMYER